MVSLIERGIGRGMPSSSNQEMQLEPILTQLEPALATPRPVGRPRKQITEDNKPGPMSIEPQKRKTEIDSPGKERAKAKKTQKREQEMNRIYLEALKNEESEKKRNNRLHQHQLEDLQLMLQKLHPQKHHQLVEQRLFPKRQ